MTRALPVLFALALGAAPSALAQGAPGLPGQAAAGAGEDGALIAAVQRQTDAYNAHDAKAYAACFAPDAQLIQHPGIAQVQGRDDIYKTFARVFREHGKVQMRILYRAQLGPSTVIEHQVVEGLGGAPVPSLVIYSLKGGVIQAAWFVGAE
ncbi:MAG TPA: SgcJ/EcaC family oxidoreductase [Holophagaceae bacterium]|nr:SgcJ/EcaC family oxidoreductase [Holophagaceae bacterium]